MGKHVYAYDIIQLRPGSLVAYPHFEYIGKRSAEERPRRHDLTTESSAVRGTLSDTSRKKLKKAIQLLVASAVPFDVWDKAAGRNRQFRTNFITLTLPAAQDTVTDEQLKRVCLNEWLVYAKRKRGLNSYVWKAEPQQNGNLHFHVACNVYFQWEALRASWNHSLRHFGFVDRYRENMLEWHKDGFKVREELLPHWDLIAQKTAYEYGKKTDWRHPNSTHVEPVDHAQDLAGYLIDYFGKKEEGKRLVQGKVWGCSKNLLPKEKIEFVEDDPAAAPLLQAFNDLQDKLIIDERFTFLRLTEKEFERYVQGVPRERYEQLIQKVRNHE